MPRVVLVWVSIVNFFYWSGMNKEVKIGAPLVEGAKVSAKVLKQSRAKKVIVFHYHSKTRYKKKAGHRQHFTEVEILKIS